jgi:uracil-DNA glycosylase family 4
MDSRKILGDTIHSLRATLEHMARWGCPGFECPPETVDIVQSWTTTERIPSPCASSTGSTDAPEPCQTYRHPDDKESLEQIRMDLGDCQRCGLSAGRKHIVYGEGSAEARLVFVGEGPGAEEDRSGRPFVGRAGQLLSKIIEAMKLSREQVYICNVIKCRPAGNRDPLPEEIASCRPFLLRQLTAIDPEVVCTLGTHATQALLNSTEPVSRLRGRFHTFSHFRVMPTFHPAYLLRHPEHKRDVWEDMKKIMALLRIPL